MYCFSLVVDEASSSRIRRADLGIPYFVFDLNTIESETAQNRLKSAASFMLTREFESLNIENPYGLELHHAYMIYGVQVCFKCLFNI